MPILETRLGTTHAKNVRFYPGGGIESSNVQDAINELSAQSLEFSGDSGSGSIGLDGQTLSVGTSNDSLVTSASGQTLTIALADVLEDIDALGPNAADGEFLVGTGPGAFVWESGDTARTSLGLGTGDSPTFASLTIGSSVPFSDAAGALTLQNVDALDATTEATVEGAIDALANLTSIQGQTVSLSGPLTVEAASVLDQDLTQDAGPTFAGLTLNGSIGGTGVGIDDGDVLTVDAAAGAPNDDEYARFTANGLEGRTEAEFKADFNLEIGTDVQAHDAGLDDISGLAVTDGNFIVGDGANWVAESGATVRTSLGLGTGDTPEFTGLTLSGDITDHEAANDANPQIRLGASDAEELHIQSVFDSAAQTLDYVLFQTDVASATANTGLFRFNVDGADILDIDDGGIDLDSGKALSIAGTDVLDATTLGSSVVNSSLTSVGTIATGTWQGTAIDHERGGLEADVSAFTGLLAISGGSTSEVDSKSELEAQIADVSDFAMADGDIYTGTHDFGGADDLEVPNAAAPTIDTDGQVAVDTSVTDFAAGVLKYHSGEEMGVVAMPVAQFGAPSDGDVPTYNATTDQFEMSAGGGGSGAPDDAEYLTLSSDAGLSGERIAAGGVGIDLNDGGVGNNATFTNTGLAKVRAAADSNVDESTELQNGDTIDGVTLATGDLVLLTGQTDAAENGIYEVVGSGGASRHFAFDTFDVHAGLVVAVAEGNTYANSLWQCTADEGGTLGMTALPFVRKPLMSKDITTAPEFDGTVPGDDLMTAAMIEAGALVEYGSNSNGDYWRFESGLQICRGEVNFGSRAAGGSGSFTDPYRTGNNNTWTFPAAFNVAPSVATAAYLDTIDSSSEQWMGSPAAQNFSNTAITNMAIVMIGGDGSARDVIVTLTAIGLWKATS